MSAPILVACLVALRAEFNEAYPNRDKGADGWIGDAAHQQESSDHNPDETGKTPFEDSDSVNEVHALDIDADLRDTPTLAEVVDDIRLAHQTGRDDRLQNIIYRGKIASRSWGWTWRTYDGASKHFDHAHFSARYTSAQETDTSPWGVLPPKPEVPTVTAPSWNSQTVLDLNFLFHEAWRATQDGFPVGDLPSGADKNARNLRNYLADVINWSIQNGPLDDQVTVVGDAVDDIRHDVAELLSRLPTTPA